MSFLAWIALASGLLLLMALVSSYVRDLPITTSALYLGVGLALGPLGVGVVDVDLLTAGPILEHLTEAAVVIALFIGGLKLRLHITDPAWRAALLLAGPVMLATIAGVAALAHLALGLPFGAALLLGAILAPTDPVLASAISVADARDHDRMRYGLSGEAGLNDGTAFPFVLLALAWIAHTGPGDWLLTWAVHRLLYAIPVALVLGFALGKLVGKLAIRLRTNRRDATAPSDLLALALIGVAYVAAEAIGALGFLSVFAAGLGLRSAELAIVRRWPHPDATSDAAHPPAEKLVAAHVDDAALEQPAVTAGVLISETLSFGDTIERLVEVGMIVAVGAALSAHWDARAIPLAAALFLGIRPLASLFLLATPTTRAQRGLMAWFGIRGIGSLYYLGYALEHGLHGAIAHELTALTISVIALSIVVHGVTSTPLLSRYERAMR